MDRFGYNNPGRSNERVIPISFDGGRQPQPNFPSNPYVQPVPPTRPQRQPERPYPGNPPRPVRDLPTVQQNNSDFTNHELDDMEALGELLKRKRAAEGKPISGSNSYRLRSEFNSDNYAEGAENQGLEGDSPNQPGASDGDNQLAHHQNPTPTPANSDNKLQYQAGFVMPGTESNSPTYPQNQNLPYPSNPSCQSGIPPYPPANNQYPGYPPAPTAFVPGQGNPPQPYYYPPPGNVYPSSPY